MTILFGEFLIKKGLLPKEKVLEALIYQIVTRSSLPELIFENHLLSCEEQLKVLSYQVHSGNTYQMSAEVLGIWNEELAKQVTLMERNRGKPPLGEVLVKLGFFDIREMTQALGSFLEYRDSIRSSEIDRSPRSFAQQTRDASNEAETLAHYIEARLLPELHLARKKLESPTSGRSVIDEVSSSLLAEFKTLRIMCNKHQAQKLMDLSDNMIQIMEGFLHDVWKWEKSSKVSGVSKLIRFLYQYLDIVSYYLNECPLEFIDDKDINLLDIGLRLKDSIESFNLKTSVK